MFGSTDNIKELLINSMDSWRTGLTSCGENIGEVRIRTGIFQGDSLSPLLFVVALIPMTLILRKARFALHGQHLRQTESISCEGSWLRLEIGKMKKRDRRIIDCCTRQGT